MANPYEEGDKIPSDLSIDHHPYRTCDYSLTPVHVDEEGVNTNELNNISNDSKWILENVCISDLCFNVKNATMKLLERADPAQLSDIRLLALNDIYKLDKNFASSVSKYFTTKIHTSLKPALSFESYLPADGLGCYGWCRKIETSPPADWISAIKLSSDLLSNACVSMNMLDIHTAHVLTQILPVLVNGPPDDSNEDSYVHYYLSPLLTSVFGSDPLLKMKWANGQLIRSNQNEFKPDFLVYNLSGSVKCIILIAEFKPTEQNSYVESDLIKLAKQMKIILNGLIVKGVSKPKVCGIHCEGENVETYVMDIPSPKLYRLVNASKTKLFKNLDQISLLPNLITHILCLKEVAVETATKIETASFYSLNQLRRQASDPPVNWLSNDSFVLTRISKKQKK